MRRGRVVAVVALLVTLLVVGGVGVWVVRRSDRLLGGTPGGDPPGQVGVAWEAGLLSPDGGRLAVRFPGVADPGDQPCGADYVGLVGATLRGLRITVITIPRAGPVAGGAPAGGEARSTSCPGPSSTPRCTEVRLPYPPAERPVYDGVSGASRPVATAGSATSLCDQLLGG